MRWLPVSAVRFVRVNGQPALQVKANLTDRAFRYRAVASPPPGPKVCAFCGSKRGIMVGHVNGHEEDGDQRNLVWTCRSCNVKHGNAMKRAGLGRRTRQFNPKKQLRASPGGSRGARNLGQWLTAVLSAKGELDAMSVRDAVEMIRATSPAKRSEYAGEIWRRRRARGTDRGTEIPF